MTRVTRFIALAAFCILMPAFAWAGPVSPSCDPLKPGQNRSDMDMLFCANKEQQAERDLYDAYKTLSAKLSSDMQARLAAAQKFWFAYRDAQCVYEGASLGPALSDTARVACIANMNRIRIAALRREINASAP